MTIEETKEKIKESTSWEALKKVMDDWSKVGLVELVKELAILSYDEAASVARDLMDLCEQAAAKWDELES